MAKYVSNWLCKVKAIPGSASPEDWMLKSLVKTETTHLVVFNRFGVPTPDPSIQRLNNKAKHGENKLNFDTTWELISIYGDNKLDFDATRELISIVFCLQKHPVHSRTWFRKSKPMDHN